jgi:cytochrome c6
MSLQDDWRCFRAAILTTIRTHLLLLLVMVAVLNMIVAPSAPAWAMPPIDGAEIFQAHCVGCHINGGNIIRRGKTLKLPALKRQGVDSIPAIAALVANGKSPMSAYRDRLTDAEIQAVATYVLQQAEQGWK